MSPRGALSHLVNEERLRRILTKMLDENEFLSPCGIRSLSRFHKDHPYTMQVEGQEFRVDYLPAESNTGMFGGNSNWRGPVWMPVNIMLIRALQNYYLYYGDNFKIECPTGSGKMMNLFEVSKEIADRLSRIFLRNEEGKRPVYGGTEKFQNDPNWRDYILFFEYFHGDNGAGLGASHQTGWTGLVAKTIQLYGLLDSRADAGGRQVDRVQEGRLAKARHDSVAQISRHLRNQHRGSGCVNSASKYRKPMSLATVPEAEWDAIGSFGFDAVWFMGVWERSPAGIEISMRNEGLLKDFKRALPDFSAADNVGSPYCVRRYIVDEHLGGPAGLAAARSMLRQRGIRLISTLCPTMLRRTTPGSSIIPNTSFRGQPMLPGTIRRPSFRLEKRCLPWAGIRTSRRGRMCSNSMPFSLDSGRPSIETISEIAGQCDGSGAIWRC